MAVVCPNRTVGEVVPITPIPATIFNKGLFVYTAALPKASIFSGLVGFVNKFLNFAAIFRVNF